VRLLLDTHTLLWFLRNDPSLTATAKAAIEDPANHKLVSIATCWEMSIKAELGKLRLVEPVALLLARELPANNFGLLDITLAHATAVEALPRHHKDPFDRLLIAQAQIEGIPIVSADAAFDPYGIIRIW
jgi:PIN domain nuclease of toxin-antitoxin system